MSKSRQARPVSSLLRPPKEDLRALVRWIFVLIGLTMAVFAVPPVLSNDNVLWWPIRPAAILGLALLCFYWVRAYKRGSFSPASWAPEGLAVFAVILAAGHPPSIMDVAYAGIVIRSLYGSWRDLAVTVPVYVGTFFAAVAVLLSLTPLDLTPARLLLNFLGPVAVAVILHLLINTIGSNERALGRERILREAGARLVGVHSREGVYETAVDAALELAGGNRGVRIGLALGPPEEMVAVAGAGENASELEGRQLNVHQLPGPIRDHLLDKRPVEAEGDEAIALRGSLGMSPTTRPCFVVPLFIENELRGTLVAASDTAFPVEVKEGLEALGFQVALALESVAFAEDRLRRESEHHFRTLVQNASDVILIMEADRTLRYISPSVEKVLGYKPEEVIGKDNLAPVHPDDLARVRDAIAYAVSNPGTPSPMQLRLEHADGSWRHLDSICTSLLDDPDVGGIVINSRDVTERKQAEEALRQSEARFRSLIQNSSDIVMILVPDGTINYVSPSVQRVLGYAPEDLIGDYNFTLLHPDDLARVQHFHAENVSAPGAYPALEARLRHADGSWRYFEGVGNNLLDDPDVGGIVVNLRDVTERKRAEEALRASETSLAEAQRIAHLGSWEAEPVRPGVPRMEHEMRWSDEMFRIFGFAPREFVPTFKVLQEATHPEDMEYVGKTVAEAASRRESSLSFEHRILRPDGEVRFVQARMEIVYAENGELIRNFGTVLDITEQKQAEEEVRRSERRLLNAQRIAHVGDWSFDVIKNEAHWSDEMHRIFGLFPRNPVLTYKKFLRLVHPDDRATVREMSRAVLNDGGASSIDYRVVRPDGEARYVHSEYEVRRDAAGKTTELIGTLQDVTERKLAEAELAEAELKYRTLIEQIPVVTYIQEIEHNNATTYISPQIEDILGYSSREYVEDPTLWLNVLHPEDRERVLAEDELTDETCEPFTMEYRMIARDGRVVWVRDEAAIVRDTVGRPLHWRGVMLDITERKLAEEELRRSEERFRSLVQNSLDVITVVDSEGTILYYSPSVEAVMGYKPEEFIGKNALEVVPIHPEDLPHVREVFGYLVVNNPNANYSMELRLRHADGSWRTIEATANNLLDDPNVGGIVTNYRDITDRKAFERQLEHQAFHDDLTGLPNRALFMDRLEHALSRVGRDKGDIAVLFMDLDNFKVVNDSLGHQAGDELLVLAAERLRGCCRPSDTVARLGGDEFIVLLEEVTEESDATALAERFADQLREPFALRGRSVHLTASVGIAFGSSGDSRPEELLREADIAMYRAKHYGKARYKLFDVGMGAEARERLELENDLRSAIQNGELEVYYQPTVALDSNEIAGFEALLRWEHPTRGAVSPSKFIPIAEETGLIVPLGRQVLREACRQARTWQERNHGGTPVMVSVNLSAKQLQEPGLAQDVVQILRETGLSAHLLCLEVTETVAMEERRSSITALNDLKDLGVTLAIDDFGTGYSSLSYLKDFPVDYLKIDRSIVTGLERDSRHWAIVLATITLAHALGLRVVAEGVETAEEFAKLRTLRCDLGQGHYFSEALPATAATDLLSSRPRMPYAKR